MSIDRRERIADLNASLLAALDGRQTQIWTALVCIVASYNAANQTCQVQPAILAQFTNSDGSVSNVALPLLVDCPVIFPGGGGYTLTFPIAPGDECLVVIASRCIDSWWQSSGVQLPAEFRMHDLSDGFVLVGPRSVPRALGSVSTTAVELRNDARTSYVSLDNTGNAKVNVPGEVDLTAGTVINLNAATVNVSGNLAVVGMVTGADFGTSAAPSYNAHVHNIISGGVYPYSAPPKAGS